MFWECLRKGKGTLYGAVAAIQAREDGSLPRECALEVVRSSQF